LLIVPLEKGAYEARINSKSSKKKKKERKENQLQRNTRIFFTKSSKVKRESDH
jgi:hypothetical protein